MTNIFKTRKILLSLAASTAILAVSTPAQAQDACDLNGAEDVPLLQGKGSLSCAGTAGGEFSTAVGNGAFTDPAQGSFATLSAIRRMCVRPTALRSGPDPTSAMPTIPLSLST